MQGSTIADVVNIGFHLKFNFNTNANSSVASNGKKGGELAPKSIACCKRISTLLGSLAPAISMARPVLKSPNNRNITGINCPW
jgi:hypothetical protein